MLLAVKGTERLHVVKIGHTESNVQRHAYVVQVQRVVKDSQPRLLFRPCQLAPSLNHGDFLAVLDLCMGKMSKMAARPAKASHRFNHCSDSELARVG
jgi:hypothetical protein